MSHRLAPWLLALGCACSDSEAPSRSETELHRSASSSQSAALSASAPRVAMLLTRPGASHTRLVLQPVGGHALAAPVASVSHLPDAESRGVLLPNGARVALVTDVRAGRDASFGAALFRLDVGGAATELVDSVVHATRPAVVDAEHVAVERGTAGPEPSAAQIAQGELRADALWLDLVNVSTGATRTVHQFVGYTTHLCGVLERELLVYRVRFGHADLVAIDVDHGSVRALVDSIPGMARDFSVDASTRSLVYANHDDGGWFVERLGLDSGVRSRLATGVTMQALPSVWLDGGVLLNDGRGAVTTGGGLPLSRPLGDGFDQVRAWSPDGALAALLHHVPGAFSRPFAVDVNENRVLPVAVSPGHRVDVVGVLP
ncbi:MAG: hypothetical protein KF718_20700 [Polyangiaceae bacterium]|nr:hypothetical protein [Polyangiaceae bacterium]